MKILFLLNSGFDTNGPSNHLFESLIVTLLQRKHDVHIIEKDRNGPQPSIPDSILSPNLTHDVIIAPNIKKTGFVKRYVEDVKYALCCIQFYKRRKGFDIVFLQSCNVAMFHLLFLKIFLKKPVIYNVQDIFPMNAMLSNILSKNRVMYKTLDIMQKLAYKMADKIITVSEDMKNTLIKIGVPDEKISVVYNWSYSDDKIFISDSENLFVNKYAINPLEYKVVYAGNVGMLQNVDIIVDTAIRLRSKDNLAFYIIGDGAYKDKIVRRAERENLSNIKFYPMQDSALATHIYSMADINIIPLMKDIIKVAMPSKTATCLAVAKPIVACVGKGSCFFEMMRNCDKCEVIDSEDSEALVELIMKYYNNNVRDKSENAYNIFNAYFSREKNVNMYADIIESFATN